MSNFIDLIGKRFGSLQVIKRAENDQWEQICWLCQYDCGNKKVIRSDNLRRGITHSCGCLRKELIAQKCTTHGKSKTLLYHVYKHMHQRCYNSNDASYINYGGRGIYVCDEWRDNIEAFYRWALVNGYQENLTLDRIDNDGNYEPSNCRFVTRAVQSRNRRSNIFITNIETNERLCASDWSLRLKGNKNLVIRRLSAGWDLQRAITKPAHKRSRL